MKLESSSRRFPPPIYKRLKPIRILPAPKDPVSLNLKRNKEATLGGEGSIAYVMSGTPRYTCRKELGYQESIAALQQPRVSVILTLRSSPGESKEGGRDAKGVFLPGLSLSDSVMSTTASYHMPSPPPIGEG